MKDDIARGVQSTFIQQIAKTAADMSVRSVMDDKSLIKDQAFLKALSKVLARISEFNCEARPERMLITPWWQAC